MASVCPTLGGGLKSEDLVHGLLRRWWEDDRQFNTREDVDRLMMASIPNRARDLLDRERRQVDPPPEDLPDYQQHQVCRGIRPDILSQAREEACAILPMILDALSECTPAQREAFVLRVGTGLTYDQIAGSQATIAATVRKRIQRVRKNVAVTLASARHKGLISKCNAARPLIYEMISAHFRSVSRYQGRT